MGGSPTLAPLGPTARLLATPLAHGASHRPTAPGERRPAVPSPGCCPQPPSRAALTVLAAVADEGGRAAAVGLVALVDRAAAVVEAVVSAHLLVAPGPREAGGAATGRHACEEELSGRRSDGPSTQDQPGPRSSPHPTGRQRTCPRSGSSPSTG